MEFNQSINIHSLWTVTIIEQKIIKYLFNSQKMVRMFGFRDNCLQESQFHYTLPFCHIFPSFPSASCISHRRYYMGQHSEFRTCFTFAFQPDRTCLNRSGSLWFQYKQKGLFIKFNYQNRLSFLLFQSELQLCLKIIQFLIVKKSYGNQQKRSLPVDERVHRHQLIFSYFGYPVRKNCKECISEHIDQKLRFIQIIGWIQPGSEIHNLGYQFFTLSKQEKVKIPQKKSIVCGLLIFISSISFMESMYFVSYPFIMMSKSCSILQVVIVGVFCSRVKDKKSKLGIQKILTSLVVTIGIIIFKAFDPETSFQLQSQKSTEFYGILFLLINILADSFLPDFQAEIKQKIKPKPVQMRAQLSKWSFLLCFIYAIFSGDLVYTLNFMILHPTFSLEIITLSVLSFIGQIFVYKMINNFQQHIVPFIVSTRKTLTVTLSLIYFGHKTSFAEIIGILIVFLATIWELLSTVYKKKQKTGLRDNKTKFISSAQSGMQSIQISGQINSMRGTPIDDPKDKQTEQIRIQTNNVITKQQQISKIGEFSNCNQLKYTTAE